MVACVRLSERCALPLAAARIWFELAVRASERALCFDSWPVGRFEASTEVCIAAEVCNANLPESSRLFERQMAPRRATCK